MHYAFRTILCLAMIMVFILSSTAQQLKLETDKIMHSSMSANRRVDSLFQILYVDYYKDYTISAEVAQRMINWSEKTKYKLGAGKGQLILALAAERKGNLKLMSQHIAKAQVLLGDSTASLPFGLLKQCEGIYFRRKKQDKQAMAAYLQGLSIAETIGDKQLVCSFYTSLGIMAVGRKEYDTALSYYHKTMALARAINDKRRIQRTYTNFGIVYMRKKEYKRAVQAHLQALKLAKELNLAHDIAFVYNDLGAVYLTSELDLEQAARYLRMSIAMRERLGEKNEIAYTYNYLGQVYLKRGDEINTIIWVRKAYQAAKEIENNKQQYEALEELANVYRHFSKNDSAYIYLKAHIAFRDSVRKVEHEDAIAELTIKYETDRKEKEIALLTQKNTIQRLDLAQRNLYLIITVLLVIGTVLLAWLIYRANKLKELKIKREAALQVELLALKAGSELQSDRLRISRDLHDNIGANLTFINTSINQLYAEKNQLSDVKNLIADTIVELRRTVWLINKPSVQLEEWLIKLREYFRNIEKVQIVNNSMAEEPISLSAKLATAMFRISQEAVNNAIKYASATAVTITLTVVNEVLLLAIADNGIGFNPDKIKPGYGLNNMNEHAMQLDGTLIMESVIGQGTKIAVKIPL